MTESVAQKQRASLAFRCVDLVNSLDVDELQAMVDRGRDVTFETFARQVDWVPLAKSMGYAVSEDEEGMRLDEDRAASFRSSTWRGERVYYMVHSAIEFVFRLQPPEKAILPTDPWGGILTVDTSSLAPAPRRRPRP